jgi:RNA polymerase sigma-70 factor (ECF subfamily)
MKDQALDPRAYTPASTAGDADGIESARHFRPMLIRYFRRHLGNGTDADAEDLAQEALIRLIRSPTQATNTEAYLLRIASNLLRDRFRRERSHRQPLHDSFEARLHDMPSEEPGSDRVYEDKERLRHFLEALDQLPPRCRQVFLLQRYDGLTYASIAKRLAISVSAVEKHMMRALLHFQTRLAEP